MEAFYFGKENHLYGVYHKPAKVKSMHGIIICHPVGHEYYKSYFTLRRLAIMLSEASYHVLRFDFFGNGDSFGDDVEGNIRIWCDNLKEATLRFSKIYGVEKIIYFGVRIGANIAAAYSKNEPDSIHLIAWEPLINGKLYLDELTRLHKVWLQKSFCKEYKEKNLTRSKEMLGYNYSNELVNEIKAIPFSDQYMNVAKLLLINNTLANINKLKNNNSIQGNFEYLEIDEGNFWDTKSKEVKLKTLENIVFFIENLHQYD